MHSFEEFLHFFLALQLPGNLSIGRCAGTCSIRRSPVNPGTKNGFHCTVTLMIHA